MLIKSLKIFVFLILVSSNQLKADNSLCSESLIPREAAFLFEQGLIGRTGNRYVPSILVEQYGSDVQSHDSDKSGWLFRLETDVLDILRTAPEFRQPEYQNLADAYGIDIDKAEYIVLYYARLFYDDIRIAGDPTQVFPKLRALNREHILSDASPELMRRYLFYLNRVTMLSVSEMAESLGIDEHQVYHELSSFGISIEEEFEKALAEGQPTGEQALDFYQHYKNEKYRGVRWDREFYFDGTTRNEEDILTALYLDLGIRQSQLLADKLNELAGTNDLRDLQIRTAASVSAKLRDLKLTETINRTNPDITIPGFGNVKVSGKLVAENALAYIDAHYYLSDRELASDLGVELSSLKTFLKRHYQVSVGPSSDIQVRIMRTKTKGLSDSANLLAGYREQRGTAAAGRDLSRWMAEHNGRLPKMPSQSAPMSEKDAEEYSVYQKMGRYAASNEEAISNERKARFMAQLTAGQRELVITWHTGRNEDPFIIAGKDLSGWMTEHNDQLPKQPYRNGKAIEAGDRSDEEAKEFSLYHKMGKYASSDEETKIDERKAKFMAQLTANQRDLVIEWHRGRKDDSHIIAGKELSSWMAKHNDQLPKAISRNGKDVKSADMSEEETKEFSLYQKMRKYAASDEEAKITERKAKFMRQLTAEQKKSVLAWHMARIDGPFITAGKELNEWMTKHKNRLPRTRKRNGEGKKIADVSEAEVEESIVYRKMGTYVASDEETKSDERKAKFMAQLTPEQRALVPSWHEVRKDPFTAAGKELSDWMTEHNDRLPKQALKNGKGKKSDDMSDEEVEEFSIYNKMRGYAASDEEAKNDEHKAKFMAQLTPEQKTLVLSWHKVRQDPLIAAGKELSDWMTEHSDRLPKNPVRNSKPIKAADMSEEAKELAVYRKMGLYAASEEEAKSDDRKAKFMAQLTPEQAAIVATWHQGRRK